MIDFRFCVLVFAATVVNSITLPVLPLDGCHFVAVGSPSATTTTLFGFSRREQWSSRGRFRELKSSLGFLDVSTYSDVCRLFDSSLVVVGNEDLATVCAASGPAWPPPSVFPESSSDWSLSPATVECGTDVQCDEYVMTVDFVLWKNNYTAWYVAGTNRPVKWKLVSAFGATTTVDVTEWHPWPQDVVIPRACDTAIADALENDTGYEDDYVSVPIGQNAPPPLPCSAHVKVQIEAGSTGLAYTEEKWRSVGSYKSVQTVGGIFPVTQDTSTTYIVRRDLNMTFSWSSTDTTTCTANNGRAPLDDGRLATLDLSTFSWSKQPSVSPCPYGTKAPSCDLYTGTKAITFETLKLAYSPGSDVLLGGEDIRTILFVTVKAPISVLMWESGTPLDASVFDPITACGGPYSALPNPSMDWVHKCLSFCNQTIPVHHSSESSIHGVVTSESHEPGSSRETTHVSGSVSQSFNALLVVLLAMVVASF